MEKEIKIWYDKEADYLEVIFEKEAGYFQETDHDAVMEKVSMSGKVLGFSVLNVSEMSEKKSLSVILKSRAA
jgi:uncharacterized protein YuzE